LPPFSPPLGVSESRLTLADDEAISTPLSQISFGYVEPALQFLRELSLNKHVSQFFVHLVLNLH
jgi:hypothetical protein